MKRKRHESLVGTHNPTLLMPLNALILPRPISSSPGPSLRGLSAPLSPATTTLPPYSGLLRALGRRGAPPGFSPTSPVPMEHSSAEDSDISDSDIAEHKEEICAQIRAGKLKVKRGEAFRCPFCPGKMRQDYNLKDLLQHATGIGAASKRSAKVRASHLGLAMFLEKDIASSLEKPLQIVPYKPKTPKEEEIFVWPWMGVVVNLQCELKGEEVSRESEERLTAQLSRFRPLQATILGDGKDQPFCAIIKFAKDWSGFKDAMAFENHFALEHYSKPDWKERNCRKDDLYGWLARTDDYNSAGPIGEYLRKNGNLKSVADLEREGLKETGERVAHYALQIEDTNTHMLELEQKKNVNAMKLARMLEENDRLVEEHNERILNMQQAARRNSWKIINDNIRLHEELETKKKEIARRHKELEKSVINSTDREKLEVTKEEIAKENMLLDLATLKQKEEDEKFLKLVKEQEQEKEEVMKMLYDLEMQLASKQKLELEREQLRGNLEVRKHMGEEDAKSKEMLDKLHEELKEKDEEMESIDSINQALIIKQRRTNDELEEAKKELITDLVKMSSVRSILGVKRMGELDDKAFLASCKEKTTDEEELATLCSKWEDEIRQPEWHPFKVIDVGGQAKEIEKK
ncbi:factor of DNA methylation 1-like isoform X2 [Miscanthus floridulus]|uniref:factor of DNA methylation 1-like isoform X2 n=1 Tax=Miscanthus floridulus TaxID=154761 RepID=UPI003458E2AB